MLYLHDGQNCFDRATSAFGVEWQIDETLTRLIAQGRVPPLIVVGLDNGLASRIDEYTYHAEAPRGGGAAAKHADFVMKEVKPFIDATYRTAPDRAHTYVGGSSLGGLISLELARRHNGVFGGAIAMSPALWWADESLTKDIERDPGGLAATRIWIDMGTRENLPLSSKDQHDAKDDTDARNERLVEAARRLDAALAKHDVTHRLTIDDQHAEHNEAAWAARFPTAIEYLLAPPPTPR